MFIHSEVMFYLFMNNISLFLVNKRLDEWVTEESLDTRKVHFPRRDGTSNTGVSTPKKMPVGTGGSVSR